MHVIFSCISCFISFFFSSRRRHTRLQGDWSSDVCSSDLLLQVGGRFTGDQEQLIERLGLRRYVRSVPFADEVTLRRAYRAADVLLYPSLYEGFGVQVLEAFASGLPVVTSGAGGLKEVGGDAVVVVEGRDPAAYVAP